MTATVAASAQCKEMELPVAPDAVAPDGSDVRVLLGLHGGGMAHFELPPGAVSSAVTHRTVEEIWYVLSGLGEMWRRHGDAATTIPLRAGTCLTIPLGTHFQFRAYGYEPLSIIGITMPPWPGSDEAIKVSGAWTPTVSG
jgi:mannose-6-phosphate isomerase-like protein (cupin superfamily)